MEYSGLSRIIERKGNSTWSERIVLNSFLIDNEEKLLVNEDENKQKNFPKERVYLSQAEVEQNKLEPALQSVVADLDFALLKFRKFLATIGSDYEKTPDGVLPYNIVSMFRDIQKYQKEIDLKLANLPKKVELSLRKSFPNYKLITGLTTHAFGDLGEEQITLTYNPILAPEMENYRRLNVFDKDDNLLVPFRTWRNTTTEEAADKLTEAFGFNIPQRWSIAHLYQAILNNEPHVPQIVHITTLAGYVHYLLTYQRNFTESKDGRRKRGISYGKRRKISGSYREAESRYLYMSS